MDESPIEKQTIIVPRKENPGGTLKIFFIEGISILLFVFIILAALNYFNILNVNNISPVLSFLPTERSQNNANNATNNPINGNTFNGPIKIDGKPFAAQTFVGTVTGIVNDPNNDYVLIYIQRPDGEFIKYPFYVSRDLSLTLLEVKNKNALTNKVSPDALKQRDNVIVSANIDDATGKQTVTDIRINRL